MNIKRFLLITCILFASLALAGTLLFTSQDCEDCDSELPGRPLDGCTVIMVGKDASTDGSTMTTHTCDCSFCDWTWRHVPAADHEPGSKRKIYHIDQFQTWPPEEGLKWESYKKDFTGLEIPQVPHTYAYHHGMFGYMNDQQLAIGESTIGCHRKMRNPTPSAKFDITMLTLLAVERCKTAREAIKLMGSLSEKHGYGFTDTGEMLAVADPNEVWVFEVMPVGPLWTPESGKPGAIWCAQRVPDDHVSVCPNESRIGEIDLNNADYFMASPNAVSYAAENGYYDPESGEPFNWKKAYSPTEGSAASSRGTRVRPWRFFDLVAPSQKFDPETLNMELPFSVKPEKKISVKDVINLTRDKFQGSPFNPIRGLQGGPFKNPNYVPRPFKLDDKTYNTARTISVNRAEYTTVTQCRGWLPNPIGGIVWLAFGAQDTSCYMPLYAGITKIPHSFEIGDHWIFSRDSARWAFDYVDFHTLVAYSLAIEDVKKAQEKWEAGAVAKTETIDKFALELFKKDPIQATEFLTDYCYNNANSVVNAWWELGDQILVKYNHLRLYDTENRKTRRLQYPEWWLRELVNYDKLVPQEPPKKE
ncbi:MAG: dipeptidase [Candidatus Aminicenantaceae bacterium]